MRLDADRAQRAQQVEAVSSSALPLIPAARGSAAPAVAKQPPRRFRSRLFRLSSICSQRPPVMRRRPTAATLELVVVSAATAADVAARSHTPRPAVRAPPVPPRPYALPRATARPAPRTRLASSSSRRRASCRRICASRSAFSAARRSASFVPAALRGLFLLLRFRFLDLLAAAARAVAAAPLLLPLWLLFASSASSARPRLGGLLDLCALHRFIVDTSGLLREQRLDLGLGVLAGLTSDILSTPSEGTRRFSACADPASQGHERHATSCFCLV